MNKKYFFRISNEHFGVNFSWTTTILILDKDSSVSNLVKVLFGPKKGSLLISISILISRWNQITGNDVNNQQDTKTFSFISLFNSALHVSERQIRPSSGALFDYIQLLVQCTDTAADRSHRSTGRQQCRCIGPKAVIQPKSAPEDGRICRPKHVVLN